MRNNILNLEEIFNKELITSEYMIDCIINLDSLEEFQQQI